MRIGDRGHKAFVSDGRGAVVLWARQAIDGDRRR
jgi:hypothetical protein